MTSTDASLRYEHGRISRVVFDQPNKKNAINGAAWGALAEALAEFEADAEARVLVLTGANGAFSSGADLSGGFDGASPDLVGARLAEVGEIIARLHTMPKPTVAVVPGVAAGVGLSLALCCDLVVAGESARFGAVFSRVGLTPDGGASWLLPRLVGPARAKELILSGRVIDADEADRIGLLTRLVPDADLEQAAEELCESFLRCPPVVAAEALALLDASWARTFDEALAAEVAAQRAAFSALLAAREGRP